MAVASSRPLRLALLALTIPSQPAFGFAALSPVVGGRQRSPCRAATLLPASAPIVRPARSGIVYAVASAPSAAPIGALDAPRSLASRLATALLCTLATVLATACRALAVTASKTVSSTAPPLITANTLKWGAVSLLAGAAFFVNTDKTSSSGFQYAEEDAAAPAAPAPAAPAASAAAADADPVDAEQTPVALDDSAMASALSLRMAQLLEEKAQPQPDEEDAPLADSTDGWGTGSTAVLERPKPDSDTDAPRPTDGPVEFPVGWPLVDNEDVKPAASDADIAMLERMFGTKSD